MPPIMLPARLSRLGWLLLLTDIGTAPLPYCGVSPDMLIESWRPETADFPLLESKFMPDGCCRLFAFWARAEVRFEVRGDCELLRGIPMAIGDDSAAMVPDGGD